MMPRVVAGIDIGNQTGKAVVMTSDRMVVGTAVVTIADEAAVVAERALAAALDRCGLRRESLAAIVATGVGRNGVPLAQRAITDLSCAAKGAVHLFPSAQTVIDIGAEDARVLRCDSSGRMLDFTMNDKCAAGAGVFIEAMANALEVSLAEMGDLSMSSGTDVDINSTCAVFAESEVVSLIHRQVPRADIARGILDSIAVRTVAMLRRVGLREELVFIGGTALNAGMVQALVRRTGLPVRVPEDPVIVGALGAALYALEEGGQ